MMSTIKNYSAIIAFLIFFFPNTGNAQQDSIWVLKFIKKGHAFHPRERKDYLPGKDGFYLYQNCIYDLVLKNDDTYQARILAIKKDSITITTHVSPAQAKEKREHYDILTISPASIKKITRVLEKMLDLHVNTHLRNYRFEFDREAVEKNIPPTVSIDTITSIKYETMRHLTTQGLEPETIPVDTLDKTKIYIPKQGVADSFIYRRRTVWLLPINADEINGLAVGLFTGNLNQQPLKIKGVNLSLDVPAMFGSMFLLPFHFLDAGNVKRLSDSLADDGLVSIKGFSTSLGGVMDGKILSGFFINGGICETNTAKGIFITGGFNYFQSVKGVSIGGLRNSAVKCTGIQIGLVNVCKHLKGLQIGLWNVNSKRKLPFINWGS